MVLENSEQSRIEISMRRRRSKICAMTRARRFVFALTLFAAVAATAAQERAPRVPGIDATGMDLSVRPQDDFFRYVNGRWADNTPIPADQSGYGTFAILRDHSQEAVRAIIDFAREP